VSSKDFFLYIGYPIRPQVVEVLVELEKDAKGIATLPPTFSGLERTMFAVGAEEVEFEDCTYQRVSPDRVRTMFGRPGPVRVLQYRLKQ